MDCNDTYKTLAFPSEEVLFKVKNSKFFAYAFPVTTIEEVKNNLENLRKKHFAAVHFCYAYQLGTNKIIFRINDDGEPTNSAGVPIYGQILSFGLTNILVVVVRYFGGIKLGVGGLISAYKNSAHMALESTDIVQKTIDVYYKISFDYKNMNKVMRVIKEKNISIKTQKMEEHCEIEIAIRQKNAEMIQRLFLNIFGVQVKVIS